jgi:hypothetical protein
MNYQSPNVEESRTSRKKKSGKRAADETFANLDCAGAARTRLIAEELIEQLTRTQTGDLADQGSPGPSQYQPATISSGAHRAG